MAEYSSPQSTPLGGSEPPVTAALLVYLLFALAAIAQLASSGVAAPLPLLGIVGIVAVIIAYVKRDDAAGTWVASHLRWLIRTFWWSILWSAIGFVMFITLLGIPFALAIWAITSIWVLYRVIRGYLLFKDSRPIPGM
jgi:uncharacterized membrane protein